MTFVVNPRQMALEKEEERKEVVELEQENVDEQHKADNITSKEQEAKPTFTISAVTTTIESTTTTITGKRGRDTDEEEEPKNQEGPNKDEELESDKHGGKKQEPNKHEEKRERSKHEGKREPNKHGGKHEPSKHRGKQEPIKTCAAVYGNYYRYYGYRVLKDADDDPRLKYLKREWFEGKDCLDVGCNSGNLTITIAKNFACKSMVGVDIDAVLVHKARKLLENVAKNTKANRKSGPDVNCLNREETQASCHEAISNLTSNTSYIGLSGEELLKRVSFKEENFISYIEVKPTYDTVLCLSVTKWVHLNWGDDGLIKLFAKIRKLLRPGGILVLEPQPWTSYQSNHMVSEVVQRNYHEVVLRPDNFREVLLDRVGFRSMQNITKKIEASVKGFSRPIYLLRC